MAFLDSVSINNANTNDTIRDFGDVDLCNIYQNNTSLDAATEAAYTHGQVIVLALFFPIIMSLGVLNNLAFIYVVIRVPRMRTVTNCYLVGLSVADILFLVVAPGSKIWCYLNSPIYADYTPLGLSGCLITQFIINTSYFITLCFITLVSWERYNGVCRPHRKRDTKLRVFQLITLSFFGSCFMSATLLMSYTKVIVQCISWPAQYPYDDWPTYRLLYIPLHDWMDMYSYGAQTVPFFILLIINIIFYQRIIIGLSKSMSRSRNHSNHRWTASDSSTKNQIAKMLVINGIALFALLAPFEIMSLFQLVGMLRGFVFVLPMSIRTTLVALARVTSYFNAVVNPVIYTALSSRYREAFKATFLPASCRSQHRRNDNSLHGSTATVQCGLSSRTHESKM